MSLELPSTYQTAVKRPFKENWLVKVFRTSDPVSNPDDCLFLAFGDTTVDSQFYKGCIKGDPEMRGSIDISKGKAKESNIGLKVINYQYNGSPLSVELLGGSNKYLNKQVYVYSQLNDESTLSNCHLMFVGRLDACPHDKTKITMSIISKRPWDGLKTPSTKSNSGVYAPWAYGDYSPNGLTGLTNLKKLYPAPFVLSESNYLAFAVTKSYSAHVTNFFDSMTKQFPYLAQQSTATASKDGVESVKVLDTITRTFRLRCVDVDSSDEFTNSANAHDSSKTSYAESSVITHYSDVAPGNYADETLKLLLPEISGKITACNLYIKTDVIITELSVYGGSVKIYESSHASENLIVSRTSVGTSSASGSADPDGAGTDYKVINILSALVNNQLPDTLDFRFEVIATYDEGAQSQTVGQAKVYDVYLVITTAVDDANEPDASKKERSDLETVYIGGDGLTASYTGGSGVATQPNEIHRDILKRVCGFDVQDSKLDGWSDLDTARASWGMRAWETEPKKINDILEKIALEGCFVFKFRPDSSINAGGGRYIFVRDSYSSGDVVATLSDKDIQLFPIQHTILSKLVTSREINYDRHPAKREYLTSVTALNSTARANWIPESEENLKTSNLDYYVGPAPDTDPTNNSPNDDFGAYMNNLVGDIKLTVPGVIKNPQYANLEEGDIITFDNDNMPVAPFGYSWTNRAFMLVKLTRRIGLRRFTAIEVGTIS